MRALFALVMLTACRFGFDPTSGSDAGAASADAVDAAPPTTLRADIVFITRLDVCLIGDACTTNCVSIQNDANADQFLFQPNANFYVVPPGDPRIATAIVSKCLTTTLDASEVAALRAEYDMLAASIASWSRGSLVLDLHYHEATGNRLSLYDRTVWPDQASIPASVLPELGPGTDIVYITNDLRDDALGLHMTFQYCGLSYGTDTSPNGYAYIWNPHSSNVAPFECVSYANERNYFMGELHRGVHRLTTFDDAYDDVYPACGTQTIDPSRWFPTGDQCMTDPDYAMCGDGACGSLLDEYHQHIIDAHWTRDLTTTLNHCRNGVMDFNETGVDTGGSCP